MRLSRTMPQQTRCEWSVTPTTSRIGEPTVQRRREACRQRGSMIRMPRHRHCLSRTMVGSGVAPDPQNCWRIRPMTKAEMEEAIRNLDRRVVTVEQILPTLATRADVAEARLR